MGVVLRDLLIAHVQLLLMILITGLLEMSQIYDENDKECVDDGFGPAGITSMTLKKQRPGVKSIIQSVLSVNRRMLSTNTDHIYNLLILSCCLPS